MELQEKSSRLIFLEQSHSSSSPSMASPTNSVLRGNEAEKFYLRDKIDMDPDIFINNPSYTDFRFKVNNVDIGLSGIILSSNSSFIREKIEADKCRSLDVTSLDLTSDQMLEMVRPLYNGQLILSSRNLIHYVMFATLLGFGWMFDCCVSYFKENINSELVFELIELSLRSQNHCIERYKSILKICGIYLEESNNMNSLCNYIKDNQMVSRLNKDIISYISKIETLHLIDIISLILEWLKMDTANMDIVPTLLTHFDFTEVFKNNGDLAEDFFTHLITGEYSVDVRKRIMNLSFQSCKNLRHASNTKGVKASFRKGRIKSKKDDVD